MLTTVRDAALGKTTGRKGFLMGTSHLSAGEAQWKGEKPTRMRYQQGQVRQDEGLKAARNAVVNGDPRLLEAEEADP